jgi:hypothetical protein
MHPVEAMMMLSDGQRGLEDERRLRETGDRSPSFEGRRLDGGIEKNRENGLKRESTKACILASIPFIA